MKWQCGEKVESRSKVYTMWYTTNMKTCTACWPSTIHYYIVTCTQTTHVGWWTLEQLINNFIFKFLPMSPMSAHSFSHETPLIVTQTQTHSMQRSEQRMTAVLLIKDNSFSFSSVYSFPCTDFVQCGLRHSFYCSILDVAGHHFRIVCDDLAAAAAFNARDYDCDPHSLFYTRHIYIYARWMCGVHTLHSSYCSIYALL